METGVGTTNGCNDALVLAVDCRLRQVCTEFVGKDQPFRILPVAAQQKFCCICHRRCCCNRARTVCAAVMVRLSAILGRNQLIALAPFVLMQLHLLFHRDNTCMKVDAIPCQAQYSPSRIPVNSVRINSVSKRFPCIAFRNAVTCASSKGIDLLCALSAAGCRHRQGCIADSRSVPLVEVPCGERRGHSSLVFAERPFGFCSDGTPITL